jgi:hypothetical protein
MAANRSQLKSATYFPSHGKRRKRGSKRRDNEFKRARNGIHAMP